MKKFWRQLKIIYLLGITSVFKVMVYRLQIKCKWFKYKLPIQNFKVMDFQLIAHCEQKNELDASRGRLIEKNKYAYFFSPRLQTIFSPPKWFLNIVTNTVWNESVQHHWSELTHFSQSGEDIKVVWELSRFYWLVDLSILFKQSKDQKLLDKMKCWLVDWCEKNPINSNVNWLCAQEVGIRLVNFILAIDILEVKCNDFFEIFILTHMKRIMPTMHYASGQCNNHITSEVAALYIGSQWLLQNSATRDKPFLIKAQKKAIYYLLHSVRYLILSDGTFSQYSVTYHRMVLDTLSLIEHYRKKYLSQKFSEIFYSQYRKLYEWLLAMVNLETGQCPNMGANDGTLFFKLDNVDYRDFRPTLQLASVLLHQKKLSNDTAINQALSVLNLSSDPFIVENITSSSKEFKQGGVVKLVNNNARGFLRYPKFKFRPSQIDCFHFDFWYQDKNYLLDGGSFSYNCAMTEYFSGAKSHNLVICDESPIMPAMGRFLVSDWRKTVIIQPLRINNENIIWEGRYQDINKHIYHRKIIVENNQWRIIDKVSSYHKEAALYWHLLNVDWSFHNHCFSHENICIEILCNNLPAKIIIENQWQSLYYQSKEKIPLIKVKTNEKQAQFETIIHIK